MEDVIAPEKNPPRRRRWRKILFGVAAVLLGLFVAFPWFASSERARVWLLAGANAAMSPSRLDVERFRFSWFRATEIDGLSIYDPQGTKVVESQRVSWERNLFGIFLRKPNFGSFKLTGLTLDLERRADGSINLEEALRPILKGTPATDFRIQAGRPYEVAGLVRLRSPELGKPLEFPDFRIDIHRPAAPGKITWDVDLANEEMGSLSINGDFDRWDGQPVGQNDLACSILMDVKRLPLVVGEVSAVSRIDGSVRINRRDGRWSSDGELKGSSVQLAGGSFKGDTPTIDVSGATWKVGNHTEGWIVEVLDVRSPLANLHTTVSPADPTSRSVQIGAKVNLVEMAKDFPHTLGLREGLRVDRGLAEVTIRTRPDKDATNWEASASLSDVSATLDDRVLSWKLPLVAKVTGRSAGASVSLTSGGLESDFLRVEGRGDLDRGIKLSGTLDLAAMVDAVSEFADLGDLAAAGDGRFDGSIRRSGDNLAVETSVAFDRVQVGPKADPLEIAGLHAGLSANGPNSLAFGDWKWSGAVDLKTVSRAGLVLEDARVSIREDPAGIVSIDSVDGTLNGGKLHLIPELTFGVDPTLRLLKGSTLENAAVTEEASRRVLSFIAPVLDGASVKKGTISARIDRAEFPLSREATRKAQVEGQVVFQDMEFTPGPIASDLLALIGRNESTIRLDQPVVLSIADGRIHQTGLVLPVGKLTRIAIEGDVGFDRSLDLAATIPITSEMFPNGGGLIGDIMTGTRITVPITGTLSRPRIDREAFREEMARMGKGIGMRAATRGAAELLFRLARPRDPDAPPPLTPAERKTLRQERKLQKRGGA